jgi:hypothetical protein
MNCDDDERKSNSMDFWVTSLYYNEISFDFGWNELLILYESMKQLTNYIKV